MPDNEMSVADLMNKRPELVSAFVAAGMICVGCAMAVFCDLLYVKDIYGLEVEELLSSEGMVKQKRRQTGNSTKKVRRSDSMLTPLFSDKKRRSRRKGDSLE